MNVLKERNPTTGFLWLLSFVEMWERFSYYGMRALLVLFLTTQMGLHDHQAYSIYALFASVGYLGCVLFGYIADAYFSPRYMLCMGAIIMMIGYTFMAFGYLNSHFIYYGIALIAIGTSAFKGNITNILGICFQKLHQEEQQDA